MHPTGDRGQGDYLLLNSLDEAALHAVYDRLSAGVRTGQLDHATLGSWSDTSTHVFGRIGYGRGEFVSVFFGAAWQNGNVRPHALTLNPSPSLGRGVGSARWSGRLIAITPRAETVAGAADIAVDLGDLRGTLDFTGMETWAAHSRPGTIDTGVKWGDGGLNHRISINGQVFYETGGDAGRVTGAFFGQNHESFGGTLRRTDLAAGFGAERQ